ncbi:WAP four-disulfide core domain protein 12-like isoform X2 [Meriones unguiculatus]|uniref:WAP four-disulfide core domain protein 12-like isoform X2 n=1 Tax=Meriones unguiculatus TaxID=10047 RepID=UPI000B4F323E|nr:WAP four-disulfide core domain protein 12-like isoform X2 [Meriones unguiculatus]
MRSDGLLVLVVVLISTALVAGDGVKEKAGVCPVDNWRCIRTEGPLCHRDRNCEGEQKCCYLHCRYRCVQPVKTLEDNGALISEV